MSLLNQTIAVWINLYNTKHLINAQQVEEIIAYLPFQDSEEKLINILVSTTLPYQTEVTDKGYQEIYSIKN